jgi:hypothetical protein
MTGGTGLDLVWRPLVRWVHLEDGEEPGGAMLGRSEWEVV